MDPCQLRCPVVSVRLDSARRLGCTRVAPRLSSPTGVPPMMERPRLLWITLLAASLAGLAPLPARAASPELAKLCDDYWQGYLRFNPTEATAIGDRRYDALLDDNSPASIAKETKWLEGLRARARAFSPKTLDA